MRIQMAFRSYLAFPFRAPLWPYVYITTVSRQLQAVDCDEDDGIVMREIAVGLRAARGLLSLLSRNSHIEVDNKAILHSSF
jgi:hypothetical protein